MQVYSLFDLNEYIKRVLALNFTDALWIRAEIGQVGQARGHFFVDLVEKSVESEEIIAQSEAVLWQQQYRQLKKQIGDTLDSLLQEGLEVQVRVQVSFHERYGLKLVIEDIDPTFTLGKLELRRRDILTRLSKEGLLEKNKEHTLPPVLQKIAVLTSERAAGYQDFLKHLEGNTFGYRFDIQLFTAAVQGTRVEEEIVARLAEIAQQPNAYDAVVIIRGGGAKLDLAAFDSYAIAQAVAGFPLPVFTGIGHEVDETVLDVVAHTTLKTPTAVADFLIQHNLQFESNLNQLWLSIQRLTRQRLHSEQLALNNAEQRFRFFFKEHLREKQRMLAYLQEEVTIRTRQLLKQERQRLENLDKLVHSLHPEAVLRRGFSVTLKNGKTLTAAQQVQKGDLLQTHLKDGTLESRVE